MDKKENQPKEIKPKKKLSSSQLAIAIGLAIIAVPIIIFVLILGISALQTGSPRNGNRFKNDLDPAITNAEVSTLKSDLSGLSNVESVEIELSEGQLRIYIDATDSLDEAGVDSLITQAYNKVNTELPIKTYFTSTDSEKMYDLFINVYTTVEDSDTRQYKVLHKNGAEEEYDIDDLAHAKDEDLVKELHNEESDTTTTDDSTGAVD